MTTKVKMYCDGTGAGGLARIADDPVDRLAREFSKQLLLAIGPRDLAEAARRNAARGGPCCATHDFCDANMSMDAAFQAALGYSPLDDDRRDADGDMTQECVDLFNAAWDRAKAEGFFL